MSEEISRILNDRESGSIALLNRLITALEKELQGKNLSAWAFNHLLINIREKLHHFAAIENFLASLIDHTDPEETFPGEAIRFIKDYRLHWQDSSAKITENFIKHCQPGGLTMLTHSHSETVISLLNHMHEQQIPFRIIQTLSTPGEEGRKSHERMRLLGLQADLTDDTNLKEAIGHSDLILMACDALLSMEFLNKTGTRSILEQAKQFNKPSYLVTESRKEINNPEWKMGLTDHPLFEWVPLNLIDRIVSE